EHHLALVLGEVVERVEELVLGLFLLGQELDVVEQQDVHVSVLAGGLVPPPLADRPGELADERLGGHVPTARSGGQPPHVVRDGEEQVRLPQAHATVDEQGVVRLRGGRLGNRKGGRVGELVAGTGDERLERVPGGKRRGRQG